VSPKVLGRPRVHSHCRSYRTRTVDRIRRHVCVRWCGVQYRAGLRMTDTALLRTIVKPRHREATDAELALFDATCERTGLDPLARQIYAQFRKDSRTNVEHMAIQATIDGFRVVAERSGDYLGGDAPQWCGADGVWCDVWLDSGTPAAARGGG